MSKTNSAVKLTRKADPVIHQNKPVYWNGQTIKPESKETVFLFGNPADAEVKASENKIRATGRDVKFINQLPNPI